MEAPINTRAVTHPAHASAPDEPQRWQEVAGACEGIDRRLWAMILVVLAALASGFIVIAASATQAPEVLQAVTATTMGLAVLVTLLNIYVQGQRRALKRSRAALLAEIVRGDACLAESFLDPATGVFNRRYFDYLLIVEAKRADRGDDVFALLMVDIDGFKSINDRWGHREGDATLREVGRLLRRTFRQTDTVIRYGGDEFVVLMPQTNESRAVPALERLRRSVTEWNLGNPSRPPIEISWGIATYRPGETTEGVVATADRRMYERKRSRDRNRAASVDEAVERATVAEISIV